jgi:hypothetical protein
MIEVENCRGVGAAAKFLTSQIRRGTSQFVAPLMAKMSVGRTVGHIPIEPIFPKQVRNKIVCFCFLFFDLICSRSQNDGLDEMDPTMVEGTKAAVNLETAGYPEVRPFLRWVRKNPCTRNMRD